VTVCLECIFVFIEPYLEASPQEIQWTQAQGLNNTTPILVYNTTERRLHAHTHTHTRDNNSQTPKKLRKNTRKLLPCKYYLPTALDTYKQRHTPQRFTHFYISHTCSLSLRKPNAPSLRTRTHSKTLEADQLPPRTKSSEV